MKCVLEDRDALLEFGVLSRKAAKLRRATSDISELRNLLFENAMLRCDKLSRNAPPKPEPPKRENKLIYSQYYEPLPKPCPLVVGSLTNSWSRSPRRSFNPTASPTEEASAAITSPLMSNSSRCSSFSPGLNGNTSMAFSSFASPTAESLRARVRAPTTSRPALPRVPFHDLSLNSVATIPQQEGVQLEVKTSSVSSSDINENSGATFRVQGSVSTGMSPVSSSYSQKEPSPTSSHTSRASSCSLTWSDLPIGGVGSTGGVPSSSAV